MDKILFWAPGVIWSFDDGELLIGSFLFRGEYAKLFPKFYWVALKGNTEIQLNKEFNEFDSIKLKKFIKKLINLRVMVSEVQGIDELFYGQSKLFQPEIKLKEEYFLNATNVEKYVSMCLSRSVIKDSVKSIVLEKSVNLDKSFTERRSTRSFEINKVISFKEFSTLMFVIQQYSRDSRRYYCYPSAGGLYPIDCYVHIKAERIEGIEEGLYYYDTVDGELKYLSSGRNITKSCHFFQNKEIFTTSSFSMHFFYNSSVSMPKYNDRGYYYGIIDTGILIGYLNIQSEKQNIGSCSIGELQFKEIEHEFKLNSYQKYLHTIEFGPKNE